MLTGVSTEVMDAILAWWADQSITTEQILDGWDLEGVHGESLSSRGLLLVTSVVDLVITDTGFVVGAGSANLGVDICMRRLTWDGNCNGSHSAIRVKISTSSFAF